MREPSHLTLIPQSHLRLVVDNADPALCGRPRAPDLLRDILSAFVNMRPNWPLDDGDPLGTA